ncbi:hypothetical protein JS532_06155 [Bifidobacterium callimiconis]|uniref:hypothetical protein n=1 Tax=Bifidobacterium callimiconis TaxID=2306973 RepID=UPI001BDD215C|nr:hypothetical protein [Bifidobacterium callimiconis]MBT1177149.1 hypothetical protein [Bifidobacterium callimiconis]
MIRIKKTPLMQYALLYLMLLIPGSCAVSRYLNATVLYGVVVMLYLLLMIINSGYRNIYIPIFVSLLAVATIVIRAKTGGVGPLSFLENAAMLIIVYIAAAVDKKAFLLRYIRIVCVFAVISIVFWSIFCIFPSLVSAWPATSFWTQDLGTGQWATTLHGKGLWLYSYLEIHATRNCGFYTEPGVYQIVLNSVLFVLLFWRRELNIRSEREYWLYVVIIITTLITCQSTTGYISMLVMLIIFFISNSDKKALRTVKWKLAFLVALVLAIVVIDFLLRGRSSLLYSQVLNKLFGGNVGGGLNLADSTGQYRMITVMASLKALSIDPYGIGFDAFYAIRDSFDPAAVAASIATYAAVYGIIFWLAIIIMILYPVLKYEHRKLLIIAFCFMFVNSTTSETYLFYPGLMVFPIYLSLHMKNFAFSHFRGSITRNISERENFVAKTVRVSEV